MITVVGNKPVMRRGDNEIGVVGDNLVKTLEFSIDRIQGAIDLNDYSAWALIERSAPNGGTSYSTMVTKSTVGDKITISLPITANETKDYGYVYASIKFATANAITAFANYGSTVAGTVKATSANHGLDSGVTTGVVISGTTNYNGTYDVTKIDANNFYFTDTWVSDQTGWWGVSPIWQTERVMLKVAKGINGETEAEALETNIFDAQVAAFQAAIDVLDLTNYEHTDNKITSISASSTDGEYPSGKAVWAKVQDFSSTSLNTYLGYASGVGSSSQYSVGVGAYALNSLTSGISNTSVGALSLDANTTGYRNTAIGRSALSDNISGYDNVSVGAFSLELAQTTTGCTAAGTYALNKNTAHWNTAIGNNSLQYNTAGYQNSALGADAARDNISGVNNTAIGFYSSRNNTNGIANTTIGAYTLDAITTGSYNTVIGMNAAHLKTTSSDCVYIGYNCQALQDATQNEIAIGSGTTGAGSNTATLGNANITDTVLRGNVKIGTKITASNGTDPAVGITATAGDSSTKLATTAFVQGEIAGAVGLEMGTVTEGEDWDAEIVDNALNITFKSVATTWDNVTGDNKPSLVKDEDGYDSTANARISVLEQGYNTVSSGSYAFSSGYETTASGDYSHSEGYQTLSSGESSHAEGNRTTASGIYSHAEGAGTNSVGDYAHAEGLDTTAYGEGAHAEGRHATANGIGSHSGGYNTIANGNYSTAIGNTTSTISSNYCGFILGQYGDTTEFTLFSIANGSDADNKSLALNVEPTIATWNVPVIGMSSVSVVTDTYDILDTDEIVVCDKTTDFIITLPVAVVGRQFKIKNVNSGIVTVEGNSTDTIEGELNTILTQWKSVQLVCYATNKWVII